MVTIKRFKELVLSFPEVVEQPHFDKVAYKIRGKRIFATLSPENLLVCAKLSLVDQSVFCSFDKAVFFPVDNKWGLQGYTYINLKKVRTSMLKEALTTAYQDVLKTKQKIKS